jgi:hypothetical protein
MKPDRIVRAVAQLLPSFAREQPWTEQVWAHDVVKLLRRESAYQRARVRRIIKALPTEHHDLAGGPLISYGKLMIALKKGTR